MFDGEMLHRLRKWVEVGGDQPCALYHDGPLAKLRARVLHAPDGSAIPFDAEEFAEAINIEREAQNMDVQTATKAMKGEETIIHRLDEIEAALDRALNALEKSARQTRKGHPNARDNPKHDHGQNILGKVCDIQCLAQQCDTQATLIMDDLGAH